MFQVVYPKDFSVVPKRMGSCNDTLSEELEHDGSGVKNLVGEFSESKDT